MFPRLLDAQMKWYIITIICQIKHLDLAIASKFCIKRLYPIVISSLWFDFYWMVAGVTIEARLPQMPLFQGSKVPQFSKNANDAVSFPLSHSFQRILVIHPDFNIIWTLILIWMSGWSGSNIHLPWQSHLSDSISNPSQLQEHHLYYNSDHSRPWYLPFSSACR